MSENKAQGLSDADIRAIAVDPSLSCIVRAPAGSGKTSLLVLRYLKLLARAKNPEEVLCVTFTNKATDEMRERIISALRLADSQLNKDAMSPMQRQEYTAASAVLERDGERGWNLLRTVDQLNITTLDGLCAKIVRSLPVARSRRVVGRELIAPGYTVEMDCRNIYERVVRRALLGALDGEAERGRRWLLWWYRSEMSGLEGLLRTTLANRGQWVQTVASIESEQQIEENFQALANLWVEHFQQRTYELIDEQMILFPGKTFDAKLYTGTLNTPESWAQMYEDSYTQKQEVRKKPKVPLHEFVLQQLLVEGLELIVHLPTEERSWYPDVRAFLLHLLADLAVEMAQMGVADFTGVAFAADAAMGNEDEVTDLARALDYRLGHILVDEFQDISPLQLQLLDRLVAQWSSGDGHTLMLVGDTAQSCYGFRNARPGLFNLVEQRGIGNIQLKPLKLSSNFRSHPAVVETINDLFTEAFPQGNDINTGAAPYVPMEAQQSGSLLSGGVDIELWRVDHRMYPALTGKDEESKLHLNHYRAACVQELMQRGAEFVSEMLSELPTKGDANDPKGQVAVLVRKRGDLTGVVKVLKEAGIRYSADSTLHYHTSEAVRAALALARVLRNSADRIALLALLRSALCGLSLAELHVLAGARAKRSNLWSVLMSGGWKAALSPRSAALTEQLVAVLQQVRSAHFAGSFVDQVHSAWELLRGSQILGDADLVSQLLENMEGWGENWSEREDHFLNASYIPGTVGERVRLMTIHQAKGLEFGAVWIPSLNSRSPNATKPLLHTDQWFTEEESLELIGRGGDKATHEYFKFINNGREKSEILRLVYIAATRAITRLRISSCIVMPAGEQNYATMYRELKHLDVWGQHIKSAPAPDELKEFAKKQEPLRQPAYRQREQVGDTSELQDSNDAEAPARRALGLASAPDARALGVLTHTLLEGWAKHGDTFYQRCKNAEMRDFCSSRLLAMGVSSQRVEAVYTEAIECLFKAVDDAENAWLFQPSGEVEAALLYRRKGVLVSLRVDRLVRDQANTLWVVDYKTGKRGKDEKYPDFARRQLEQAEGQLRIYGEAIGGLYPDETLRCALYFPREQRLEQWSPAESPE